MLSRIQIPSFTTLALSLLLTNLATSTTIPKNEPQLLSNVTLNTDDGFSLFTENPGLNARALECRIGYSECAYDTSRCCPSSGKCCGNGYCANIGETCCAGGGTCSIGYKCCTGGCAPLGGECCSDGYYCRAGKKCRIYDGEKVCCPLSGCIGEYDGIGSGGTLTVPDVTSTATETEIETTRATTTYVEVDWDYYYTTVYWYVTSLWGLGWFGMTGWGLLILFFIGLIGSITGLLMHPILFRRLHLQSPVLVLYGLFMRQTERRRRRRLVGVRLVTRSRLLTRRLLLKARQHLLPCRPVLLLRLPLCLIRQMILFQLVRLLG